MAIGDLTNVSTSGIIGVGYVLTAFDNEGSIAFQFEPVPDQIQPVLTTITDFTVPAVRSGLGGIKTFINTAISAPSATETTISGELTLATIIAESTAGTAGQYLTSQGAGSNVKWTTPSLPAPVVFMVKGISTQGVTGTITIFTDIVHDTNSGWESSTNSYRVKVAGYYKIHLQLNLTDASTETRGTVAEIRRNGVLLFNSIQNFLDSTQAGAENMANNADCIQYLNVDDKISGFVALGGSAYINGPRCCLNLHKL